MEKLSLSPHLLINLTFVFFTIIFGHVIYSQDLKKTNVNVGFAVLSLRELLIYI